MHYIDPNLMILPDSNPRMISKLFIATLDSYVGIGGGNVILGK